MAPAGPPQPADHPHVRLLAPFLERAPSDLWDDSESVCGPFQGPMRWASNFAPTPIFGYLTAEHAYVAAKTADPGVRAVVRALDVPGEAKAYGRLTGGVPLSPQTVSRLLVDPAIPAALLKSLHRQQSLGQPETAPAFTLRPDWLEVRLAVMQTLVVEKWRMHADVRAALAATGDAPLVEINGWGDVFWGATPDSVGANWLGRIWGAVRAAAHAGVLTA